MKSRLLLLTLMALSVILTACGGGGGGGDDEIIKPVKEFLNGFEELDADKIADVTCKQYKEDVEANMSSVFDLLKLAGDDFKIEITDLKFKVQDKKDDSATVVITSGKMKMSMAGETDEQNLAEIEGTKVIKEDGKWVICDQAVVEMFGP